MDIAALVISVFALMVAGFAAWYARRQAVAAEVVASVEQERAAKYRAPWVVRHVKGDVFAIVNDGDEPVYDVTVTVPPHTAVSGELTTERLSQGSAITPMVLFTAASPHRNIVVTYARSPGGEVLDWRGPLPARR